MVQMTPHMNNFRINTKPRQTAVTGLAAVGFVALVVAGMWLAVYSARFVPTVVNGTGSAAVYLGSLLIPNKPSLSVVPTPTASTTISFGEASSTVSSTSTNLQKKTSTPSSKQNWTPGAPIVISNGTNNPSVSNYYGLPDLAVTIESVGYMSGDTIIATTTIPNSTQKIGVKFLVTNVGTNISGQWTMNISIPSGGNPVSQTFTQESLSPGQPSEYVVHFTNIYPGANHLITIAIDPDHKIKESATDNNTASSYVTILGS